MLSGRGFHGSTSDVIHSLGTYLVTSSTPSTLSDTIPAQGDMRARVAQDEGVIQGGLSGEQTVFYFLIIKSRFKIYISILVKLTLYNAPLQRRLFQNVICGVVSSLFVFEKWVVYLRKPHVTFDLFVWAYHYSRISAHKYFFFDHVWSEQIIQQKLLVYIMHSP